VGSGVEGVDQVIDKKEVVELHSGVLREDMKLIHVSNGVNIGALHAGEETRGGTLTPRGSGDLTRHEWKTFEIDRF